MYDHLIQKIMKTRFVLFFMVSMTILAVATSGIATPSPTDQGNDSLNQSSLDADVVSSQEATMKTIGLIGGMSWYSTDTYYTQINEDVRDTLGEGHSAKILLYSVDFNEIEQLLREDNWEELTERMVHKAQCLEEGEADCVLICTNTIHKTADDVQASINIPLLHIADATGEAISAQGLTTVGLLGTKFTMEQDFIKGRLEDKFGLTVIIPDEDERVIVNSVIFDELCKGVIKDESRVEFKEIIGQLVDAGAEGIILGCTEIPLLISQEDVDVPVFDTTRIHAKAAVDFALNRTR